MKKALPVEYRVPVGRRLEAVVSMLQLKDAEIAGRLGISPQAWGNYCSGERPLPIDAAHELVKLSHVTLDWIYLGNENGVPFRVLEMLKGRSAPVPMLRAAETQPVRFRTKRTRNR